jgi:hypothetical protein
MRPRTSIAQQAITISSHSERFAAAQAHFRDTNPSMIRPIPIEIIDDGSGAKRQDITIEAALSRASASWVTIAIKFNYQNVLNNSSTGRYRTGQPSALCN